MIIGVVGPIGSGKSVFSRIVSSQGFENLSFSDVLRELMRIKGVEITRENLQNFGDELRKTEGSGVLAKRLVEQVSEKGDYVIDGFRNPAEVEEFRKLKNFHLVFVDSPYGARLERIIKRGREQDPKTDEEFKEQDDRDQGVGQDEYGQQGARCFEMADSKLINDKTLDELEKSAENLIEELRGKS